MPTTSRRFLTTSSGARSTRSASWQEAPGKLSSGVPGSLVGELMLAAFSGERPAGTTGPFAPTEPAGKRGSRQAGRRGDDDGRDRGRVGVGEHRGRLVSRLLADDPR